MNVDILENASFMDNKGNFGRVLFKWLVLFINLFNLGDSGLWLEDLQ